MTDQEMMQKARGLVASTGLDVTKAKDGRFCIVRGSKVLASGNLNTIYNCAQYIANDSKDHPEKYQGEQLDSNDLFQKGLAMAKKLCQG